MAAPTGDLALPGLTVITASDVNREIDGNREALLDTIRRAYLAHGRGDSANPQSAFLRIPGLDRSRIISLPAYLGGEFGVAGIKWIASFPDNPGRGIPRASAVLVLNDLETGYPTAVLESSIISATRTAGSAVLAAEVLAGGRTADRIGVVGTGLIADHVWRFFRDLGWKVGGVRLFDLQPAAAGRFGQALAADGVSDVRAVDTVEEAFADCDVVVLTTVAGVPHIHDPALLDHAPVVLHVSLRDLGPDLILRAENFTDDVEHAVRERTSLHLTEQRVGHRDFVRGTLADLLDGTVSRDPSTAAIFSPFGLGVLDLAVGGWVRDRVVTGGGGHRIPDFFSEVAR